MPLRLYNLVFSAKVPESELMHKAIIVWIKIAIFIQLQFGVPYRLYKISTTFFIADHRCCRGGRNKAN